MHSSESSHTTESEPSNQIESNNDVELSHALPGTSTVPSVVKDEANNATSDQKTHVGRWPTTETFEQSRLKPLSPTAEQMVLGTLLGDAVIDWSMTRHGRYTIRHGAVQRDYCEAKAALLKDYINTPAKIVPNSPLKKPFG